MRLCFDEYMHARQRLIVWVLVQTRAHLLKYERSVISCEALRRSSTPFSFIGAAKRGDIFDVKPSSRALKGIHNSEARSVAMKLLAVCASIALEVVELVHCKGSELALGRLSSAHRLLAPVA